ncbi:MAG: hypothetical protein KF745_05940 [Phycisphaeraceae bacterium]|nr:hypothetical protein [Phycisphaeraceae bacterium]
MSHEHKHVVATTPPDHEAPDAWHAHHAGEDVPHAAHGELADSHLVLFYGVGAFVVVVVASLLIYLYFIFEATRLLNEHDDKGQGLEGPALAYKAEALTNLKDGYVWANAETTLVQLPLEVAEAQVIQEYAARKD